jgi:DNA invertase Pin-like site-specific DNA recombinase
MESDIRSERAREGRAKAKASGHSVGGRPVEHSTEKIERAVRQVQAGSKSASAAARDLGMSRSGFYKRVKSHGFELRPQLICGDES